MKKETALWLSYAYENLEVSNILKADGLDSEISEDECELIDSIYISSKYPLGSVLPDFEPDESICKDCMRIGEKVYDSISGAIG